VDEYNNPGVAATYPWTILGTIPVTVTSPLAESVSVTTRIAVRWSATGATTYDVYERVGVGGTQVRVLARTTRLTTNRTAAPGGTYCYQVVAFDAAGHSGASAESCTGVPYDDRSSAIVYSGPVTQVSSTGAFLGTLTQLTGTGSQASLTFTGRRAGLVASTNGSSGIANVYLDGTLVAAVNLYARRARNLVVVWTSSALELGTHTVVVAWTGTRSTTSTGTAISLDGIARIG
jgi:hypothetical protein